MGENKRLIKVPSDALFPIIEEHLRDGQEVVICVRGDSMFPLMRSNKDDVKLAHATFSQIKKHDVVLIQRDSGAYILHRVCKKTPNEFYMIGDNQQEIEGPLRPNQLLAVVVEVYRGKYVIRRGSFLWGLYARIWLILRPFRLSVLDVLLKLNAVIRHRGK